MTDPDVSRATRATIAFMVPLMMALGGLLRLDVAFTAITAQNLAMMDIRGDYRLRVGLLVAMAAVFAGDAALGTAVANHLTGAIAATVLVSICGSVWRHLSSDYGPSLAISSTFVFLFGLATPPAVAAVGNHVLATVIGAAWGIAVQVASWPFHAEHPLRRSVSDSWVAVAGVLDSLVDAVRTPQATLDPLTERESTLRTSIDAAAAALAAAQPTDTVRAMAALNTTAAQFAMNVGALHATLNSGADRAAATRLGPTLEPLLVNLSNLARSIAVAVVSRQPGHLLTCEVRVRRTSALLVVVRERLRRHASAAAPDRQLIELFDRIEAHLPHLHRALKATMARANERGATSLELLDLRAIALRPLASALNLTWNVDPALVRFTFRSAILTVLGVIAYKELHLQHGYWLPFTMIVVLQPDYGSTRRRAAQRVLGTLAGGILATAVLALKFPESVLMVACAGTIFVFGYWIRKNYGVAVIFITLFVVLLTEATGPVSIDLAIERMGNTLAGGLLALVAAHLFWPVWERDRLPPLIAAAICQNRTYLQILVERVIHNGPFDAVAISAKRQVERSNAAVFSSLNRLNGDPKNQREGLEYAATIANGNQRITRALNALAVHLPHAYDEERRTAAQPSPELVRQLNSFAGLASTAFEAVAAAVESGSLPATSRVTVLLGELEADPVPMPAGASGRESWVTAQLNKVLTELGALLVTSFPEANT